MKYRYYRTLLNDREKAVYDAVVDAFVQCKEETATAYITSYSLRRILYAVDLDHPEFFYVDFREVIFRRCGNSCFLVFRYHMRSHEIVAARAKIKTVAGVMMNEMRKARPEDPFLYLHDYLLKTASYGEMSSREHAAHSIYGALIDHKCVCEGYAKAYRYLCLLASLQCIVITGTAHSPHEAPGPHAWNMIRDASHLYHVDLTFDGSIEGTCSRAYYRLNEKQILYNHSFDPLFKVPVSMHDGSVLKTVRGTAELLRFLQAESSKGKPLSQLRLSRGFQADEIIRKIESGIRPEDYCWYSKLDSFCYSDNSRTISFIWKT